MNSICILLIAAQAHQGVPQVVQQSALREVQIQWNARHTQDPMTLDESRKCKRQMKYQFSESSLQLTEASTSTSMNFQLDSLLGRESQAFVFPALSPQPLAQANWNQSTLRSTSSWLAWISLAAVAGVVGYQAYRRNQASAPAPAITPDSSGRGLQGVKQWRF
jgi:hypothetical protein